MTSLLTRLRWTIEPLAAHCYFVAEVRRPFTDRGLHPWAAYFAQRSAPMGAVSAATVIASFYGFAPRLVDRSIPGVWDEITPGQAWRWRLDGVRTALARLLGDWCEGPQIGEAASLAADAVAGIPVAGRPLGGATAAMPLPDNQLAALWCSINSLRELRGDGHVAALVTHGMDPLTSMVTSGSFSNLSMDFHHRNRGWTEDEWSEAVESARVASWIDDDGRLTGSGTELRRSLEAATDRSMSGVIDSIGEHGVERLIELIEPTRSQLEGLIR